MSDPNSAHYAFRMLSYEPLITISGCQTDQIFVAELVKDLPELFAGKRGLHILLPTWNLEGQLASQIRESIARASDRIPGHDFLVICSTEYEAYLLGLEAVPSLLAHQGIFIDENTWVPAGRLTENAYEFDAIYNARFDSMKRHELAKKLDRLLLVYGWSLGKPIEHSTREMKALLPKACFANEEIGGGSYMPLGIPEIAKLYSKARVGLCLSSAEGYSRTSIEYMMCGLPVVSTESIGGRDRYYENKYCRIVRDDADAVAAAVEQLIQCDYSRLEVRNHLLNFIEFERANFLRAINRIVEGHIARKNFFTTIQPFLGVKKSFPSHNENLIGLRAEIYKWREREDSDSSVNAPKGPSEEETKFGITKPALVQRFPANYPPLRTDLRHAIDSWGFENRRPKMFIRDDDAQGDHASLRSLISLSQDLSIPVLLATIPAHCDRSLARTLGISGLITGAVHGYSHKNYASDNQILSELGSDRPLSIVLDELRLGHEILLDVFGGRLSKLLVPPWNMIADDVAQGAMALGFQGLSAHGWERTGEAIPRINTHVDLVNWRAGETVLDRDAIQNRLCDELDSARTFGTSYVGIVTHHKYFCDEDWKTLMDIVRALTEQGVEWVPADELLPSAKASQVVKGEI